MVLGAWLLLIALVLLLPRVRLIIHQYVVSYNIPGPSLGGLVLLMGPSETLVGRARNLYAKFGSTVCMWFGPLQLVILISDPEDVQVVLTDPRTQSKPPLYRFLEPVMGRGLITISGGHEYRRHKKIISPSFNIQVLQSFVPIFYKHASMISDRMSAFADNGAVLNISRLLRTYSRNSVAETVFSIDLSSEQERDAAMRSLRVAPQLMLKRIMKPWLHNDWLFSFTKEGSIFNDEIQRMDNFIDKVLEAKREKRAAPQEDPNKRSRLAFLDHILAADNHSLLTDEEIKAELKTLTSASNVTTMDTMALSLLLLALHPDLQSNVHEELDAVLGRDLSRKVEFADLAHLEYLERTIKEVMRLFPAVFIFSREVVEDLKLPSGYTLPKGSKALVTPYFIHRDPRYFSDPDTMDPDRFLPDRVVAQHPYAYLPFSAGSRICIGWRYALITMKVLLATVLRRYRVIPDPDGPQRLADVRCTIGISVGPVGGARVCVQRR